MYRTIQSELASFLTPPPPLCPCKPQAGLTTLQASCCNHQLAAPAPPLFAWTLCCRRHPGDLTSIWDSRAGQLVLPAFDASLPAWHLHHLAAQLDLGDADLLAAVSTSPAHEPPWFPAGEQQPAPVCVGGGGGGVPVCPLGCCLAGLWAGWVGLTLGAAGAGAAHWGTGRWFNAVLDMPANMLCMLCTARPHHQQ
jgi:hypothetical protein